MPALHVVFAGGGTLGHLFPGIAVADALSSAGDRARITFVGSGSELEREHVTRAGYEYLPITCGPLERSPLGALRFVCEHFSAYRAAQEFLREQKPHVVVGLGGYASVPMGRAAIRRRTPLVLLEQNVVLGRANHWLASSSTAVCAAFESVRGQLPEGSRVTISGTPLRADFIASRHRLSSFRPRIEGQPQRLVVLGGTRGSDTLNKQVPRALYKVGSRLRDWQIVHQAGERGADATRELYRKLGLRATVVPFLDKMANVLGGADLALARAGGTTLAELAVCGVPALLVPYPHAKDDHQRKNAQLFEDGGAAVMLDAREVVGRLDNRLADNLSELLLDGVRRRQMSQGMQRMARPRAAADVARLVLDAACRWQFASA